MQHRRHRLKVMLDVSWKTFKASCTETHDDWLATEGINNETEESNLKVLPRKDIKLIIDALVLPPLNLINESFIHCVSSLSTDGSHKNRINRFKEGQLWFRGHEVLRS